MVKVINCSKKAFREFFVGKQIICFGAGNELVQVCKDYPYIEKFISHIVDNNKCGTSFISEENRIPIISFKENLENIGDNSILLITTIRYADQIIKQLDDMEFFEGKEVLVPYFFEDEREYEIKKSNMAGKIPKKIHYCWFGNEPLPKQFEKNIETWKRFCPDYEIIKWNEENYDVKKCRYMYEAYKKKKWGFVPDYARLDIINENGGIYLDTDVEVLRPLDELLGYELFCGFENKEYVAFGLGFGGSKNNKILVEMMQQYERESFINKDGTLNQKASPVYQTEILQQHGLICDGSFQIIDNCVVFPMEYFAPVNAFGLGQPTSKSFSIHQYAATWFDSEMKLKKERMVESILYVKKRMGL